MLTDTISSLRDLILGAFAFIVSLAWNNYILEEMKGLRSAKYGLLVYAISVTILAVIVTYLIKKGSKTIIDTVEEVEVEKKQKEERKKKEEYFYKHMNKQI